MKKKRILSLVTVLALIIGVFSMIPSVGAVSENPVNLIYAKAESIGTITSVVGYIKVENLAYDKNVTVYYSFDGNEWYDCAIEYYKTNCVNYEIWKFEISSGNLGDRDKVNVEFAIKYEVNGQTYWDNNNGQNYSLSLEPFIETTYCFGIGEIVNYSVYRYNNAIYGTVQLKNLGYEKDVKVIYTTDNWATTNEVSAEYSITTDSVEIWSFTLPTTSSNVKYKLSYTVNGVTYVVDDNFCDYYTV